MMRLVVTLQFSVRAKKGEARGPSGFLRKNVVSFHSDLNEATAEVATVERQVKASEGYMSMIEARVYQEADFLSSVRSGADPKPVAILFDASGSPVIENRLAEVAA